MFKRSPFFQNVVLGMMGLIIAKNVENQAIHFQITGLLNVNIGNISDMDKNQALLEAQIKESVFGHMVFQTYY